MLSPAKLNTSLLLQRRPPFRCSRSTANRTPEQIETTAFAENPKLIAKRNDAKSRGLPLFVFLDGPSGSGKGDLLKRLEKLGYSIKTPPSYLNFMQVGTNTVTPQKEWANSMIRLVQDLIPTFKLGTLAPKQDLIFIKGSLVTPIIHAVNSSDDNFFRKLNISFQSDIPSVTILCKADSEMIRQRVMTKYEFSTDNEKLLRNILKQSNEDIQIQSIKRYENALKEGLFDDSIQTTSIKQSVPNLLRLLGVTWNNFFNINK